MRYRIELDYIGTAYCGWQIQPNVRTVQGELASAINRLTGEAVTVTGSGRTDAGVHALKQTAHFDLEKSFDPYKLVGGLNHFLPGDIRVFGAFEAPPDFHARFGCTGKTYVYAMYRKPERAILSDRAWAVAEDIDVAKMRAAAKSFVGEKDFASFMAGGSDTRTTVRNVTQAEVKEKNGIIRFTVSANGFLYNMVRIMTKVLESVGVGALAADSVAEIIERKDRAAVKGIAPAHGLYLVDQVYGEV